jgi:hypothetical protein
MPQEKYKKKLRKCENCGYEDTLTAKELVRHWEKCIKKNKEKKQAA